MRVLIIDDDTAIREVIQRMLSDDGFETLTAANGKEGLRIVKNDPGISIVITDLIMPEKEGIETIRELKRDFPHVKILAISGGNSGGNADNYLNMAKMMGADLTLSKPFVKQDLIEAMQRVRQE